jgi:starch synthase (maltosyl-transferring)
MIQSCAIYFETKDWKNLWDELKSILLFWIEKGVTIFRVDNPHTKPFVFWEWILSEIRKEHPEVIFLSEAFTRPKIMHRLAKIGFTQSYTYFTWRTQKYELVDYVNELTKSDQRNFFRPNFWPNTPDILPYDLQNKGYAEHAIRFVLAATLSASYGMYGPVYDLLVAEPYPGKEEYNNSEKYECCVWDWETETPMRKLIAAVNQLRNSHAAFQSTYNITFCETDNQNIIAYLKVSREFNSVFLVVVNLDPEHAQSGFVRMPLDKLGLIEGTPVTMNDLLNHEQYIWNKASNYVMLNPLRTCAHIMQMTW